MYRQRYGNKYFIIIIIIIFIRVPFMYMRGCSIVRALLNLGHHCNEGVNYLRVLSILRALLT